ncbi:MAG: hypothetical protein AAGU23_04955 [Bacillota bacterium]|nr:hypothetical protein [Bacillota bacterium]
MRVVPVTLDLLRRLKQKTAEDSELQDFASKLEGMAYYGDENHQLLLVDDYGRPVAEEILRILQILWEAGWRKRLH